MRTWKLLTLIILAGAVPFGLAQEQWVRRWQEWIRSVPLTGTESSPPLQTAPYNSSRNSDSSSSNRDDTSSSNYGSSSSNNQGHSNGTSTTNGQRGSSGQSTGNSGNTGSSWTTTPAQNSTSNGYGNNNTSGGGSSSSATNTAGKNGNWSSAGNQDTKSTNGGSQSTGPSNSNELETAIEGPPVSDLREIFRFDIHPKWVLARWPRVSTVTSEPALEGLRVPLVTGPTPSDLSGALTYYFDTQKVLQRMTFHGYTGDETRIAELATRAFEFKQVPSLGAGLYMLSWNGKPRSVLRLAYAPVVRSTDPLRKVEVMLEYNRPRAYYGLSPEFQELLDQDRAAARW